MNLGDFSQFGLRLPKKSVCHFQKNSITMIKQQPITPLSNLLGREIIEGEKKNAYCNLFSIVTRSHPPHFNVINHCGTIYSTYVRYL